MKSEDASVSPGPPSRRERSPALRPAHWIAIGVAALVVIGLVLWLLFSSPRGEAPLVVPLSGPGQTPGP